MPVIKCPKCQNIFTVNESDYELIASQIRTNEFQKELQEKELQLIKEKNNELALLEAKLKR